MAILILVFSHFLAILKKSSSFLTRAQYSCCPPCISGLVIAFCTRVECNPWSVHACTHSHCIHATYSFLGIDWALFYLPEWLPQDTYNCIVLFAIPWYSYYKTNSRQLYPLGLRIHLTNYGDCVQRSWVFLWYTCSEYHTFFKNLFGVYGYESMATW